MTGPAAEIEVPVLDAWDETRALHAVRLALPPTLAREHRRPGQIVKVGTGDGEAFYALASAPARSGEADLLVKRGGPVGDRVIADAARGRRLRVTAPFGRGFPVEETEGRDVLLFAAGAGIAPIRAVVQHLAAHRESFARAVLFYGQRHGSEFAYGSEHDAWAAGGVEVVLCPSGEDDAWTGVRGRVQEVARTLGFGGTRPDVAVAFAAGMTAMVDDVRRTLAAAGVPPARVHANF